MQTLLQKYSLHPISLILGCIWLESLSFFLLYFYLGLPDLSLILDPYGKDSAHDLMPDIFATLLYTLSLVY